MILGRGTRYYVHGVDRGPDGAWVVQADDLLTLRHIHTEPEDVDLFDFRTAWFEANEA